LFTGGVGDNAPFSIKKKTKGKKSYQQKKGMENEGRKVYVPPHIEVRQVVLEGMLADSFVPAMESGEITYTEYEEQETNSDYGIF
jgi:hypothetical protein